MSILVGNLVVVERKNVLGLNSVSFTLLCLFFRSGRSSVHAKPNNSQPLDLDPFPFHTSCVLQDLKNAFLGRQRCVCLYGAAILKTS